MLLYFGENVAERYHFNLGPVYGGRIDRLIQSFVAYARGPGPPPRMRRQLAF